MAYVKPTWEKEIWILFRDFKLSPKTAQRVIKDVNNRYPNSSDRFKYERAWNKFINLV